MTIFPRWIRSKWILWLASITVFFAASPELRRLLVPEMPKLEQPAPTPEMAPTHRMAKDAVADFALNSRPLLDSPYRTDLFAARDFAPPPPRTVRKPQVAPHSVVPPKPSAPAFPYKYAGRLEHDGKVRLYLTKPNDELLTVHAGSVLDGAWRVDALDHEHIKVTHLAAEEQKSLVLANLVAGAAPTHTRGTSPASGPAPIASAPAAPDSGHQVSTAESASAARSAPVAIASSMPVGMQAQSGGQIRPPMGRPRSAAAAPGAIDAAATSVPTGRLGSDVPSGGSMPTGPASTDASMQVGRTGGSFPIGSTPSGKLGL